MNDWRAEGLAFARDVRRALGWQGSTSKPRQWVPAEFYSTDDDKAELEWRKANAV